MGQGLGNLMLPRLPNSCIRRGAIPTQPVPRAKQGFYPHEENLPASFGGFGASLDKRNRLRPVGVSWDYFSERKGNRTGEKPAAQWALVILRIRSRVEGQMLSGITDKEPA